MTKPMDYKYLSHEHCFNSKNPPCGLKGKHCCLCDMMTNPPHPTKTICCIKCTGVGMLAGKCDNPSCECHQDFYKPIKDMINTLDENRMSPPDPLSDWETRFNEEFQGFVEGMKAVWVSARQAGDEKKADLLNAYYHTMPDRIMDFIRQEISSAREQEKQGYKFMGLVYGEKLWLETGDVEIHYRAQKWMEYLKERDEELTRVETARKISDLKEAIEAK